MDPNPRSARWCSGEWRRRLVRLRRHGRPAGIADYGEAKAASQTQDPVAMQLAAATAAAGVVTILASLPGPPSPRAVRYKQSVGTYVASQGQLATTMDGGSLAAVDTANSAYDAAVSVLVAAARDAGPTRA